MPLLSVNVRQIYRWTCFIEAVDCETLIARVTIFRWMWGSSWTDINLDVWWLDHCHNLRPLCYRGKLFVPFVWRFISQRTSIIFVWWKTRNQLMLIHIATNWPIFVCASIFVICSVTLSRSLLLNFDILPLKLGRDDFWLALLGILIGDSIRLRLRRGDSWKSLNLALYLSFGGKHGIRVILGGSHPLWNHIIWIIVIR